LGIYCFINRLYFIAESDYSSSFTRIGRIIIVTYLIWLNVVKRLTVLF
jgi:hypothetical protein